MHVLKSTLKEHSGLILLAAGLLVLLLLVAPVSAAFSGSGAGTSGDPYQITTTAQWNEMNDYCELTTVYFKLMNDLNWAGGTPTQIGHYSGGWHQFSGILNGNGKYIKNLVIPSNDWNNQRHVGLFFGTGASFYVYDLSVVNADATVGTNGAGLENIGIMASTVQGGKFEHVFIDSTSSLTITLHNSDTKVGSFSADDTVYLIDCGSNAVITSSTDTNAIVGGLTANGNMDNIDRCYFGGTMTFPDGSSSIKHGTIGGSSSGSPDACFYDSTKTTTAAQNGGTDGTSKTTAQMKTQSTFSGVWTFDSTHWIMSYSTAAFEGYPIWYKAYNVPPAPVAAFTGLPVYGFTGNATVTMTDTSTNTPTSWAWGWGDGSSNSTTQNPSHTFTAPSVTTTYTVTLTATNAGGSSSTTHTFLYYITPVPAFSANKTEFVAGGANDQVTFTDASTNTPTSWLYHVTGAGAPSDSTSQNPVMTFGSQNVYDVTLTATNPAGSAGLQKTWYILSKAPVSGVYISPPATNPVNTNDAVVLGGGSTGDVKASLNWFGDGTSPTVSALHYYSTAGTFDVAKGCQDYDNVWHYANNTSWITVSGAVTAAFTMNQSSGDYPLTVAFTDTSTGGTWASSSWNFGDGSTSAVHHPTHTFATAGTYSVSLLHTNNAGASGYVIHNVVATSPAAPTVDWSSDVSTGIYPLTVAFTDLTSGGVAPYTYLWEFGDSITNTTANPIHTYAAAGVYSCRLTVTDWYLNSVYHDGTITVTIPANPTVSFSTNATSGLYPVTIAFTDATTGGIPPYTRAWTFGDGGTSTTANPTHTFTTSGYFTVTETVTDSYSHSSYSQTLIHAMAAGSPDALYGKNVSYGNAPLTVVFTDQSTGSPSSWSWNFGDGSGLVTSKNATHTFTTAGTYSVSLTVITTGGSSSISQPVTVLPTIPTAAFTFSPAAGQSPLTVAFTDISSNTPTSWMWSFGDGSSTSTAKNPSHMYTSGGTFPIVLTATNGGGSTQISHYLTVTASPTIVPVQNGTWNITYTGNYTSAPLAVYPETYWNTTKIVLGMQGYILTNTTGITTKDGYTIDSWLVDCRMDSLTFPGTTYQKSGFPIVVAKNADVQTGWKADTVGIAPDDIDITGFSGNFYFALYAVNNSAPNTGYGQGNILYSSTTLPFEYVSPKWEWEWGNPARYPVVGETLTGYYATNSYEGFSNQYTHIIEVESSVDGGAHWTVYSGFPLNPPHTLKTNDRELIYSAASTVPEQLRARVTMMEDYTSLYQVATGWNYVQVDAPVTPATFVWKNEAGNTITSASDTDKINFGLDTGNTYQNNNYGSLKLVFQKYNPNTLVWDTLPDSVSAFRESPISQYSNTADIDNVHTWVKSQIKASAAKGNFATTALSTPAEGRYRAQIKGITTSGWMQPPSAEGLILTSGELRVSSNAFAPVNIGEGLGGWIGLTAGMGGILIGAIMSLIIASLAFLFIRDARVFIVGGLAGVVISVALGLFPIWLVVILGIAGVAVLLFASGILGGKGENGGSDPSAGGN